MNPFVEKHQDKMGRKPFQLTYMFRTTEKKLPSENQRIKSYVPESLSQHRADPAEMDAFRRQRREWLERSDKLPAAFADFGRDLSGKLATAHDTFIMAPARVVYDCPPGTRVVKKLIRIKRSTT